MNKVLPFLLALWPLAALAGVPDISINSLLYLVVYIVVLGLIFYAIWWFIGYVAPPEPFNKVLRVIVGLVALIIVVSLLLGILGHPFIR